MPAVGPEVVEELRGRGADALPHPGGTLLAHLLRVGVILQAWAAPAPLVRAGVCHAWYGTEGFPEALGDWTDREALTALIGPDAEAIVYLYCSSDRRQFAEALASVDRPLRHRDRFTDEWTEPSEDSTRAYAELTVANELDIVWVNEEFAADLPALLRWFAGWDPYLSESARRALRHTT